MLPLPRKPTVVAIALAVAALHFVTGPDYRGPFRPFVTGYLIDLVLPFAMVLVLGVGTERLRMLAPVTARAMIVFAFGCAVEVLQALGIPLFGRTADPIDVVMYGAGAAAAVLFERLAFPTPAPQRSSRQ